VSASLAIGRARARQTLAVPAAWLLVLPLLVVLLIFYIVPLFNVLWISVTDPEPGLGNYAKLLAVPAMQRVLWTTLRVAASTTTIALLFGYLIAYVMLHAGARHRLWITAFVLVPFWVSVLVRAFAWLTLLRTEGLVNEWLLDLGLVTRPLALVRNELGVLIGMVHYMVPYAVFPLYANMRGIDPRLVPAARSLGAGRLRAFATVFLPLSLPGIVAAGVLTFILSLGFLVTPAILGGGKVVMISEYVRLQIFQTIRWGVGTMMASVLLLTVLLLLAALSRIVDMRTLFGAK
jgi:putative spermidine/putrescine transport system permease protein